MSLNTDIKKGFSFFLFLTLFLLGCSPSVRNLDSRGKNIICFGGSITYGVDAQEGEDCPSVLSGMLKRKVIKPA